MKKITILSILILSASLLPSCSCRKDTADNNLSGVEETALPDGYTEVAMPELPVSAMAADSLLLDDVLISGDAYTIDGFTLVPPMSPPEDMEYADKWEGLSAKELCVLSPDVMPNVQMMDDGVHYIQYDDGNNYMYVNDIWNAYGAVAPYSEYYNVWIHTTNSGGGGGISIGIDVLGGLEEYGRIMAKREVQQ